MASGAAISTPSFFMLPRFPLPRFPLPRFQSLLHITVKLYRAHLAALTSLGHVTPL